MTAPRPAGGVTAEDSLDVSFATDADILPIATQSPGRSFRGVLTIGNVKLSEIFATMREVVDADTALMTVITDEARSHGAFRENSKRLTAALNAQRALLARIDTILPRELTA